MSYHQKLVETKKKLSDISPSFCIAKWKQVSLHLQIGNTQSCHLPFSHFIPLDELKDNPSALHNTKFKKSCRSQMLKGERPSECQYCWNIEDTPGDNFSDRIIKSNETWALPYLEEISSTTSDQDTIPSYVEVSFNNKCNLRCTYCNPQNSTQWVDHITQFGAYKLETENFNDISYGQKILEEATNPYIEAFWKWFPEIGPKLKVLRVTGGEPLLSENTYKLLDYYIENPAPELELAFNSNLAVSEDTMARFLEKIKILEEKKLVKSIFIFTSLEAWGEQAEYIRYGLKLKLFKSNLEKILTETVSLKASITCTFNALSVFSFKNMLENILELRNQFFSTENRLMVDVTYLRNPRHLLTELLPDKYLQRIKDSLDFMIKNSSVKIKHGFSEYELIKMERYFNYVSQPINEAEKSKLQKAFIQFLNEHDRRSGTDFKKVFPELIELNETILPLISNKA